MQRFIIIRCFYALIVLFIVSMIVFALARISGNPVDVFLPADASEAQQRALERELGLDQPLPVQYLKFVGNALRGDFGDSINWGDQTALGLVAQRFPATMQLAAIAHGH